MVTLELLFLEIELSSNISLGFLSFEWYEDPYHFIYFVMVSLTEVLKVYLIKTSNASIQLLYRQQKSGSKVSESAWTGYGRTKYELSDPKLETLYFPSWFYMFDNMRKIQLWWCHLPSFVFNRETEGMHSNTFYKAAKVLLILPVSVFLSIQTLSKKKKKTTQKDAFPFFCVDLAPILTLIWLPLWHSCREGGLDGKARTEWTDPIVKPLWKLESRFLQKWWTWVNLVFIPGYLRESNSVSWY